MKKVMVYAYTTFNLGDDLFIKILCERYPKTRFILYAPKGYKLCFKEINNISFFPSDSIMVRGINYIFKALKVKWFLRKQIAKQCDSAVYIGGSLFMQGENWKEALEKTKSMRIKNKPFFLLGANFGPFYNEDFYIKYREIFKDYTDICFRERYSYELYQELGNVRMADDIIFQLKGKDIQQQENNIVISVIKPSQKSSSNLDGKYYKKIRDIAIYFMEHGYKINLMSFCEREGDKEAVEEIGKLIPDKYFNKMTKHFYKYNIEETLEVISSSSFVIATRFHSMILGWVYNKPVFPIVYSKKMTNVMNDVGFHGSYIDIKNIDNVDPRQVYSSMKTNLIDVSKQVKGAEKHFEKLDEYLLK